MIVLRYILGFLFLGGCWHAGALALGPDLLPDPWPRSGSSPSL